MPRVPTDEEFEVAMRNVPPGGFSVYTAAKLAGGTYRKVLAGIRSGKIETLGFPGKQERLGAPHVRKLREMIRGRPETNAAA